MAKIYGTALIPSSKDRLILQLLFEARGPLFGLEMVNLSHGQLKRGTIYVILHRLESKGLISSQQEARVMPEVGIPRRLYRLTGLGERAFNAYLAANAAFQLEAIPAT